MIVEVGRAFLFFQPGLWMFVIYNVYILKTIESVWKGGIVKYGKWMSCLINLVRLY